VCVKGGRGEGAHIPGLGFGLLAVPLSGPLSARSLHHAYVGSMPVVICCGKGAKDQGAPRTREGEEL
jgi:hypothetical protein